MKRKTNTSTAVRQKKAAKVQEHDTPEMARYRLLNFYPTPPWGARAGAEILKQIDPLAKRIWEPACGQGHIAASIVPYFDQVWASDIHDYGYGETRDFLLDNGPGYWPVDWIFTNPPFSLAEQFLKRGLEVADRGVALLCRIAFLESAPRYEALYKCPSPLTVCSPFIERLPMHLGNWYPDGDSATAYAWFFFRKLHCHNADYPRIIPIPPGTKARLTRREDAALFGAKAPTPLFDGVNI